MPRGNPSTTTMAQARTFRPLREKKTTRKVVKRLSIVSRPPQMLFAFSARVASSAWVSDPAVRPLFGAGLRPRRQFGVGL
jgi:hypothetical protein